MKDRVSTYPGRVRLTPVSGQTNVYDLERADQPTEVGTPLNKANLLTDEVAEFLGLQNTATPNDAFFKLGARQKVDMCFHSIESSGSWTVPSNLFGGKIFVIVVGGGASGAKGSNNNSLLYGAGGSGHIAFGNINVTPGQVLTAVIGAGGVGVSTAFARGNDGGSTSFGGLVAAGGSGGDGYDGGDGGAGGAAGNQGNGGNGTFGGGGGTSAPASMGKKGGNGGPYGGGGGALGANSTPGKGGIYGGDGGKYVSGGTGTHQGKGTSYMGSMEMWDLAADYYGVSRLSNQYSRNADARPSKDLATGTGWGGGGLGSIGGADSLTAYSLGTGGGGFLACGGAPGNTSQYSSGGGLFGYESGSINKKFQGGGGFYAAGDSSIRGAGGKSTYGSSAVSTPGGNGVVAIWYFVETNGYLDEKL